MTEQPQSKGIGPSPKVSEAVGREGLVESAFQAALVKLGPVDDVFNQWHLEEGSLRAFAYDLFAAMPSPAIDSALRVAVEALEKLSRLGNGERYGNSHGNVMAQDAIAQINTILKGEEK